MSLEDKLWYLLAFWIIGLAIGEFGAKTVTSLETVYQDYTSINHHFYTVVFTGGYCLAMYSILSILKNVKQYLNTVTKQKS